MTGHGISQVCDNFISDQDGYCEDNLFSQIGRDMMHFARGSGWLFRRNHGYDIGENGIWLDNCYATVLTENEVEEFGNRNVAGTYYVGIYVRQLNDRGTIVSQNFVSCREPAGSAVFEFVQVLAATNQADCHLILTDNLIKGKGSPRGRGIIAQGDAGGVLYLVAAGNRIANVGTESWFSSAVVASRRELGTLSVAGDVATGAHLLATGTAPAPALLAANGSGAPAPTVSGSDARGTLSLGSGTGAVAGDQVQLRFARAFGAAPSVIVMPRNRATAALRPYVAGESTTAFTVGFDAAPAASRPAGTYALAYHVLG
jgi:hypothetical protein